MSRKALGRGLGALIPSTSVIEPAEPVTQEGTADSRNTTAPVAKIRPNPFQPRVVFDEEALQELSQSIQENGLIQPLVVRDAGDGEFELIAGERRFLACKQAGLREVPVVVREATQREMLEVALVENLQRENLNAIEEAEAFQRLATEFGLTQERIAVRVGKSRAAVTNALRLLGLQPQIKTLVAGGSLSAGHARALLAIPEEKRIPLAKTIVEHGWSVREIEAKARDHVAKKTTKPMAKKRSHPALEKWEEKLRNRFGTQVRIVGGVGRGRVELHYFNEDDLEKILELTGVGFSL